MVRRRNVSMGYPDPQNRTEAEFMGSPNPALSTSYSPGLQTYKYDPPILDEDEAFNSFSVANSYLFWLDEARQQLEEVRQEAAEVYASDNEIDPVPGSAYDDASLLLETLFDYDIPMPDIGWAEDGSLGLEWRPEGGIATMGIYGDKLVIYGAFFEEKRQIEGICALSDTAMLSGFLETLVNLLR